MTPAAKALRYWNTLRYLKLSQMTGRIRLHLPRPPLAAMPEAPPRRAVTGAWDIAAARSASLLGPSDFRFLNHVHHLPPQGGWDDSALAKLWRYNLHYFDDLNAVGASARANWHRNLLARWIAENPPAAGTGWEPYPTSLRIVNWIKWALAGNELGLGERQSLALQARWLSGRLETHLLGNHYFANAKALVMAGVFFESSEADRWRATGLDIIARELPEQVLPDGGNFERSPMYHAIFLEDVLDLVNVAQAFPGTIPVATVRSWRETVVRMLRWQAAMLHPDGEIAFFNDAAMDIAPSPVRLADYAARLSFAAEGVDALVHLGDSGYVRIQAGEAVALLDVAPIGPDYLPGHAHADTLSFEFSLGRQRVIVNGGTSQYGLGPERLAERGTRAHSTVEVAEQNSSEVWGGFRVARRARPFGLEIRQDNGYSVACAHDGYRRLAGKPVHRRSWMLRDGGMVIADRLEGGTPHSAVARFILHPDIAVTGEAREWFFTLPGGRRMRAMVECGSGRVEDARYAPEFGIVRPTRCLTVDLHDGAARTALEWV